ncbi:MAG: permease prefix domain 1-containing protein [Planctomycetota bacterium]
MSNHEFENYLALVSRLMRLNREQQELIRDELRDHLETRVDELVQSGMEVNEATRRALEEFGDAASLAQQFQTLFQLNQRRWMMRFAAFSIAGSFLVAILTMAMWPSDARFGAPSQGIAQESSQPEFIRNASPAKNSGADTKKVANSTNEIQTSAILDQVLQSSFSVSYDEVTFEDVMDELRQRYRINVLLDMSAKDDSLTEDDLISFQIENTKLSTALRMMLAEKNATYVNQDGILRIISLDVATDPEFFRRQIFDCRKLLEKISATDPRVGSSANEDILLQLLGGQRFHHNHRGPQHGGGLFQLLDNTSAQAVNPSAPSTNHPNAQQVAEQAKNTAKECVAISAESILQSVIQNTIDPDGWDNTNGDGCLMVVSGLLVVTQTEKTLDEIESLIEELESRIESK